MPEIHELEPVNLREAWPDEARHFTPWLASHLNLLGDELELELYLEGQEITLPGAGLTGVCIGFHVGAWRVTSRSDLGSGQGSGSSHTRLQNRPRCSNHLSQAMPYRITLTVRPGFSRLLR